MTAFAPFVLPRRRFLASSAALFLGGGCEASGEGRDPGELWASAQGSEPGRYELVVGGPAGVHARFSTEVRGHGLAATAMSPDRVVMFGRRPNRVGVMADLAQGAVVGRFESPAGRHQVGHGCFSADATRLFVAEADDVTGEGTLAVLDADTLERVDELPTHGIGPHQLLLMPDGVTLVVANGGLITAPGGRDPINLDTMRSSLVYLDSRDGALLSEHTVPESKASLRHLDVADDGTVAVVMQIQRDALDDQDPRSLIAVHRPGQALAVLDDGLELSTAMEDYAGGVAVASGSRLAAVTSPRGNLVAFWHLDTGALEGYLAFDDVSGVSVSPGGTAFVLTGSGGQVRRADTTSLQEHADDRVRFDDVLWDNHLVTLFT